MIKERGETLCSVAPDWPLRTEADYDASCRACEVHVSLETEGQRRKLLQSLKYQMPNKGLGGRRIFKPTVVNHVELKVGDRVTPSRELQDVGALGSKPLPLRVTLWRPKLAGGVNSACTDAVTNRCPIFDESIHSTPSSCLAVDQLHTIQLGVQLRWVNCALWRILLKNPFGIPGPLDVVLKKGCDFISNDLKRYQADVKNKVHGKRRVETITVKMMGRRKGYTLEDILSWGWVLERKRRTEKV